MSNQHACDTRSGGNAMIPFLSPEAPAMSFCSGSLRLMALGIVLCLSLAGTTAGQSPGSAPSAIPDCRIRLVEHVVIASDRAGLLASLPFKEGDRAEAEMVVAALADTLPAAQLRLAEAKAQSDVEVRLHQVEQEMAQTELKKSEEANAKAQASSRAVIAVPELELVKLRLTIRKAELDIEKATHDLLLFRKECEVAEAEVEALRLKAPFAGIVNRSFRSVGEVIKPGDPVIELVNPEKLRIEGRIPWALLPQVEVGQSVRILPQRDDGVVASGTELPRTSGSNASLVKGTIGFIDATSDPVTHETRFWLDLPAGPSWLRPGLRAIVVLPETPVAVSSP